MKKSTAITNKFYKPLTVSMGQAVARANRYRDSLNPMRGLNMRRAVELLESYGRGEFADLMWTYAAPNLGIESADADLLALIERRVGALVELDWNIKTVDEDYPNFSATLAEDQAAALAELYYGVDNLSEAIEHLALASFRGFAHLEKVFGADGRLEVLAVIDQWNVVRDGTRGPWKYNPDALQTDFAHLPNEYLLTPERVLCREVRRPINRVGLTKVVRQNLSQKDWDAFVEIYGIPSGIIIAPPDLAQDKVGEFYEAAKNASGGSHVALPNGSDYKPNDQPRGVNPFRDHLRYLQEQLILAGTGGLLTMLTESGSGTLAGGAHADTFEIIARAEARKISEVFQRGIDREVIDRLFPGKPLLAYFELSANESVDPGEILKHAQTAAAAGLAIDADELSEKTGYALTTAEREIPTAKFQAPSNPQNPNSKIQNRAADADGLAARMERLLAADDEHFADELAALRAELPALLADADDAAVAAWEKLLGGELLAGLTGRAPIKNTTDDNGMEHDADDGKFTGKDGGADGDKKTPAPAPKRISAADADKLLAKGFTEKSADGHEVKFGARLKQHLEAAPDAAARKEYLAWGREAVRSGDRRRDTEQGEGRDYYGKTFAEGGKAKGVMVIVSVKDGEAFNLYRAHPNYLRKKGLANRGDELGEHPPIVVLRAFADAGSAPDWLQVALNGMKVNHKKSGEQS